MNYNVDTPYQIRITKGSTRKTLLFNDREQIFELLIQSMHHGQIKEAIQSSAEILSSGWHVPLWDFLFSFFFKEINYLNPSLLDYLIQQLSLYNEIKKAYVGNLKNLVNNQEFRNHCAEMIVMICLAKKDQLRVPEQFVPHPIDGTVLDKVNKFTQEFAATIPIGSILYQNFFQFVTNYYNNTMDNCIYYINWFVHDSEYLIDIDLDFKVPPILNKKSILLVLKFMILQIKTQIKSHHTLNASNSELINRLTGTIEWIISHYATTYKKQDLVTCTYLMTYMLIISRCLDHFITLTPIKLCDPRVIQACASINLVYQQLQQRHEQGLLKSDKGKNKGKGKNKCHGVAIMNEDFFQDPINQEYLRLINDSSLLQQSSPSIPINSQRMDKIDDSEKLNQMTISITNSDPNEGQNYPEEDTDDCDMESNSCQIMVNLV